MGDRSRESLLRALKGGGGREGNDTADDGLFGTTHRLVYKTKYDTLRKKLVPRLKEQARMLQEKQAVFEKLQYEALAVAGDGSRRENVLKRAQKIAGQSEREMYMNDRYLRLWKNLRDIVPKFDDRMPTGQFVLGPLSVGRLMVILRALALLDESLLLRKGGTCRHGRRCCGAGHFRDKPKGIDVGDLYLREVQEDQRVDEDKLDVITIALDGLGACLQSVDHAAADRFEEALKLLREDEARATVKERKFNEPVEFRPSKNKRVLVDSDDDSEGEGAVLFGKPTATEVEEKEAKELEVQARRRSAYAFPVVLGRRAPVEMGVEVEEEEAGAEAVSLYQQQRAARSGEWVDVNAMMAAPARAVSKLREERQPVVKRPRLTVPAPKPRTTVPATVEMHEHDLLATLLAEERQPYPTCT